MNEMPNTRLIRFHCPDFWCLIILLMITFSVYGCTYSKGSLDEAVIITEKEQADQDIPDGLSDSQDHQEADDSQTNEVADGHDGTVITTEKKSVSQDVSDDLSPDLQDHQEAGDSQMNEVPDAADGTVITTGKKSVHQDGLSPDLQEQKISDPQPNEPVTDTAHQADLLTLLGATCDRQMAVSLDEQTLDISALKKDDPRWPIYIFLLGELHRLRDNSANARQAYQSLAEWSATDPYGDTWGGSSLATIALWRWVQLLNTQKTPDPEETAAILSLAGKLMETRFMRRVFDNPTLIIGTLPQIKEDIIRRLPMLAWSAERKDEARRLFLEYCSIAGKADFNALETEMLEDLISSGKASRDRLNLLRGKHLFSLKIYSGAHGMLNKARESEDLEVRAEAGLYLARLKRIKRRSRKTIVQLLDSVIEEATASRVVQRALFERAIVSNREGKGRNVRQFTDDLSQLVEEYPRGHLADDALYQLAKHFENQGELEKSLEYYGKLRNFKGPNDWANPAAFKAALALYARGKSEDIAEAVELLQELEENHPFGPLHFSALFWLGRMNEELGSEKKAKDFFQKIIEESPYHYYAVRSRMHLRLGNRAKEKFWPDPKIKKEFHIAYQESQKVMNTSMTETSPYHVRIRNAIKTGLYAVTLEAEKRLRKKFPSQRQERISLEELDKEGILTHLSLLLALRQDVLAAKDRISTPENLLQIAGAVEYDVQDWPLAMNLVMAIGKSVEKKAAIQRNKRYLPTAYPTVFEDLIRKAGSIYNVQPELIYSVIRLESLFYPSALSPGEALGLFQFIPRTFNVLDKRWKLLKKSSADSREAFLLDPELSIHLGARWLKQELLNRYKKSVPLALMDHNAGYPAVKEWIKMWKKRRRAADIEYMIETIPYFETRIFVRRVLTGMIIVEAAGIFK
ncbi:MAG: hypothetical protein B6245_14005 [Desulfobacteraceae bacterium 4572_88]|nr:MAG: hypothetical protein B6245_14005 [Desulfobacteraceae bacterium 4572_88]